MSAFERKQSPLFAKTEDFLVWLFEHTAKFPRQYRHTLTERLEGSGLEFQRCLGCALVTGEKSWLDRADMELWQLRQLIRLAHALHIFPSRLVEFAWTTLDELGRLLGGWKKKGVEA